MRRSVAYAIIVALGAGVAAGALVLWGGLVGVAATNSGGVVDQVLGYAAVRSIRHHAPESRNPLAEDPIALQTGLQQYRAMCVACHGGPGAAPAEFAAGLNPPAPDLASPHIQAFSDAMLFETIAGGIRSTGMPAFGPTHQAKDMWSIVAFVRHLTAMSPTEKQQLGAKTVTASAKPDGEDATPEGNGGAAVHRISVANMRFNPPTLEVRAGDVVVWTNTDFVTHTATAADGTFDTGELQAGQSRRIVAAKAGKFPYACRFHPTMKGTLTVGE